MFNRIQPEDHPLEEQIDLLLEAMKTIPKDSKEYVAMTDQLVKLYALKPKRLEPRINPDALVAAGGSIAGILIIVIAENYSVISQKALGFVLKAR